MGKSLDGVDRARGEGDARVEALRLADIFRANVVDSTLGSFVFEITGGIDIDEGQYIQVRVFLHLGFN